MVFLGTEKGWREPHCVVALALLCLTASLHVDLTRAREEGECENNTCPAGLCCSKDGFCGLTDHYCGFGCKGGPCNDGSPSTSPSDSSPEGACISGTCAPGLCCSKDGFCGPDDKYCGFGCRSGPCYSSSGGIGRRTAEIGRIVVAIVEIGIMPIIVFVAWGITQRNRTGTMNSSPPSVPQGVKKLNDGLYALHIPDERPIKMDIIFFHGLTIDNDYEDAYWKAWCSDGTSKTLWPRNLLGEISFPGARILAASYNSSVKKTSTRGTDDKYLIVENLVQDIIVLEKADVERGKRPVILVGHSLGGLIIKQLLLFANGKKNDLHGEGKIPYENFLSSVCGIFYYATPHRGTELADVANKLSGSSKVLRSLKTLSNKGSRINHKFQHRWKTIPAFSIAEDLKTQISFGCWRASFNGIVVPEGSAREGTDGYYTVKKNHFGVCQHDNMNDSGFKLLVHFIRESVRKWDPTCTETQKNERP